VKPAVFARALDDPPAIQALRGSRSVLQNRRGIIEANPLGEVSMWRLGLLSLAIAAGAVVANPADRAVAQGTVQTPIDAFGQEVTLPEKIIVYVTGSGEWDTGYDTLLTAFKSVKTFLDQQGVTPAGPALTIYTAMDDVNFNFQAAWPVTALPKGPLGDFASGTSPSGKALRFVHRGSFEAMTQTYDAVSHYVEEKQISSRELLVEEYVSDILTTPSDSLVINIFVPID
jgi:effector-binding domain-containing protein